MTLSDQINAFNTQPLRELVRKSLDNYFAHMGKETPPKDVYGLVMNETEIPLLEATLAYTNGNQCEAAKILGISRSTLRKKLEKYHLLK